MLILPHTTRQVCFSDSDCRYAERRLMECVLISNDIETIPFGKKRPTYPFVMTVNAYSGLRNDGSIESFLFPFQQTKSAESGAPTYIEEIYHTCRRLNDSGIPFTGQNYVYDLMWLMRYLLPVRNWAYDSMILFWAKWPELPKRLDFISSILLDDYQYWKAERKSDDFMTYCNYAMSDTEYTLRNTLILIQMCLEDKHMRMNYFRAFSRCMAGLAMSAKGMHASQTALEKMGEELGEAKTKAWERLRYIVADPDFNPNSSQQKSDLIYGLLGAKKRNDRGKFVRKDSDTSAGANAIRAMRADHPLFRRVGNAILEAIEPAKQLSNVVGLALFDRDRFLTSYDGVATTTTRLGSRKSSFGHGGNAQNIRKDFRIFLEADTDSFLFDIDFSGSDDYYIGFESQDPVKIALLRSGRDIHSSNATIFFKNWTYESVVAGKQKIFRGNYDAETGEEILEPDPRVVHPITGIRQITKKLCHGMSFLMAGLTLLMTAGREAIVAAAKEEGFHDAGYWTQAKLVDYCAMLEARFRNHYPRLRRTGADSWYNDLRAETVSTGGFTTVFEYFQRFLGDPYDDGILRAVAASAGQANTAGRVNMVMDELLFGIRNPRFRDGPAPDCEDETRVVTEEHHGIGLRLQSHDSLTFNVRVTNPGWQHGIENIFHVMRRPVLCKGEIFQVGIEAEVSFRWAGKEGRVVKNLDEIEKFLVEVERPASKKLISLAH